MIKADEARKRTLLNTELKQYMKDIEKGVIDAAERGQYHVYVYFQDNLDDKLVDILVNELASLGYSGTYKPAEPLPPGCPSDQWYSSASLKVSWE